MPALKCEDEQNAAVPPQLTIAPMIHLGPKYRSGSGCAYWPEVALGQRLRNDVPLKGVASAHIIPKLLNSPPAGAVSVSAMTFNCRLSV